MIACLLQDPISQGIRSDVSKISRTGEDPGYNRKKKDVFRASVLDGEKLGAVNVFSTFPFMSSARMSSVRLPFVGGLSGDLFPRRSRHLFGNNLLSHCNFQFIYMIIYNYVKVEL
jgi:hypothetical protein